MRASTFLAMMVLLMNAAMAQFQHQRTENSGSSNRFPTTANRAEFVPGEYVVKYKKGMNAASSAIGSIGKVEQSFKIGSDNFAVIKSSINPQQLANALGSSTIEYVEPNFIYRTLGYRTSRDLSVNELTQIQLDQDNYVPSDEYFAKLWGMNNTSTDAPQVMGKRADIDALEAWKLTLGDKKIIVAVIDTGIDYNHPDLKNNIWTNEAEANGKAGVDDDNNGVIDDIHGASFVMGKVSGDPMDDNSHGTHCSGTIGAFHDKIGVAGVMSNVSLMAVKFLSSSGSGTLADAIKAIEYATKMGAHVMSNSWGGGGYSKALEDAIKATDEKGAVFVAAAGNDGRNNDTFASYPASYPIPNIVSVAAFDVNDNLAKFSNYGAKTVHIAAPGVDILSSTPGGKYATYSGTSMATPHVSGIVGLMLSKAQFSSKDLESRRALAESIRSVLIKTATTAPAYNGKVVSNGRASSADAIKTLVNPALRSIVRINNTSSSGSVFQSRRTH